MRTPARLITLITTVSIIAVVCGLGVSAPAREPVQSFTLTALTYNVCGLPEFITYDRGLIRPIRKRFEQIVKRIRNYDLIGLQEMFVVDRNVFEQRLGNHFVARGADSPKANPTGSGIYVFSVGEILRSTYERWRHQYDYDALSHKGFVGATTRLPNGVEIDVYSLHAQAGGPSEWRIDNYRQLLDAVARFSGGSRRPIVMLGDFNCVTGDTECNWLFANSNFRDISPKPDHVDHILVDENGSDWTITADSSRWVFDEKIKNRRLSDHLGIEAALRFDRRKPAK